MPRTPKNGYLAPKILQTVGIIAFVGFSAFWAYSGRESILFVSVSVSLILLGRYEGVRRQIEDIANGAKERPTMAEDS